MIIWTEFTSEYFEKDKWIKRTRLFMHDLSDIDITKDSRFYDVKGARQNTKFIKVHIIKDES